MAKIKMSPELIRAEFAEKEVLLSGIGRWISPYDFYDLLFDGLADDERLMVVFSEFKYKAMSLDDMLDVGLGRDDFYVSPATYYQDCFKATFLDKLYAIAIDIDELRPRSMNLLLGSIEKGVIPKPTVITNSGSGIHFYYIFNEPLQTFPSVRKALRNLYNEIHKTLRTGIGVIQKHWMGQAYRVVGGVTKVGDVTTAYRVGNTWTPEQLSNACNISWDIEPLDKGQGATERMKSFASSLSEKHNEPLPDFSSYTDTFNFIQKYKGFSKKNASWRNTERKDMYTDTPPNAKAHWYEATKNKILVKAQEGNRYSSLMALCTIAYKCQIERDVLERDLAMIADVWEENLRWSTPFNRKNVPAALRCYHQDFVKVKRETLEEWLGWEFKGSKRNGKSREEHLKKIHRQRRGGTLLTISEFIAEHPTANKSQIAKQLKMSRTTVVKYYDTAKSMANI